MYRVKEELQSWNETLRVDNVPQDPTEFSFWVAGNLPLDDGMKLHLLKIDSAVQRLRCELSIMQRVSYSFLYRDLLLVFLTWGISFKGAIVILSI